MANPGEDPERNTPEEEGTGYKIARAVGKAVGIAAVVGTAAIGIASMFASRLEEHAETSRKSVQALESHGYLSVPEKERWQPPEYPWYKLNTDGTRQPDLGFSGAGGLIRDYTGKYLVGFSVKLELCEASEAEWWGAYHGLSLALDRDFKRIILEIDNEGVAYKINEIIETKKPIFYPPATPWGKIQHLLRNSRDEVKVISIPGKLNKCADRLAAMAVEKNMALAMEQPLVMEQPPADQRFQEVLSQDSNGLQRLG